MSSLQKQMEAFTSQFVSISQVAGLTPYSAEYLSLLARKGKLDAVKINRDWLTTPQAVLRYVKTQEAKHQKIIKQLQVTERRMA